MNDRDSLAIYSYSDELEEIMDFKKKEMIDEKNFKDINSDLK